MPANPSYDQIVATTLAKYRPRLTDNVFTSAPLLDELRRNGRIRMEDGGNKIVEPLIHAFNDTVMPYTGWDVLNITPQAGISAAEYPWKQIAVSIAINGIEEATNSGVSQKINLLKSKIMQAEKSFSEGINQMLYGDATTFNGVANTKAWNGLGNLVGTGAVGGIDPAVAGNEFWQSHVVTADSDAAGPDTTVFDERQWATTYYTITQGNDKPDVIITTQALFQAYEETLMPQLRFTDNKRADSRFQNLLFKGGTLYMDGYCPAGTTYFLNTDYLGLVGLSSNWFRNTPFREVPDVDGRWSLILSYGNLVTSNRSKQGKVTGQTVAA